MHYWPFYDPVAIVCIVVLLALAPWPRKKDRRP
jgi:hypothetical protein